MRQARGVGVGAVTFTALHLVFLATWQTWFNGGDGLTPWFMNSTKTVAATLVVFAAVTAAVSAGRTEAFDARAASAALVATGGAVPMVVVLFTMRGGPGNLFPIAIFVGWLLMFVGAALGSGLAWWLKGRIDS